MAAPVGLPATTTAARYERHRPERTALYEVVRDNLDTLYGAIDDGALDIKIPAHARKELDAYLDCGLLCRGFARLRCEACAETHLVAFSCKGRGFCPSCLGRRMCQTAANLVEHVLPEAALRQWVLTFPFAWRKRLAQDGALLSALTRIFVDTVQAFYVSRAAAPGAKTGAITVVQRTSSDLRLNPHLHVVFLDGAYAERGAELVWESLPHLKTSHVGEVLERAVARMTRHLRRGGVLDASDSDADPEGNLAASVVSGQIPPAGPQWKRGLAPLRGAPLGDDKPLCASLDGCTPLRSVDLRGLRRLRPLRFTLHAATRAGALDAPGREALLRYVLRPPIAQRRLEPRPDGLVRITLKRPFSDGTTAVDMDPLSLLSRLAASVPPPRFHTVKHAGVLAPASTRRARIAPKPAGVATVEPQKDKKPKGAATYRPWADLLRRTFAIDVLVCPKCAGRMQLLAVVTKEESVVRFLRSRGELDEVPARTKSRGPPYWKSTVLRRGAANDGE